MKKLIISTSLLSALLLGACSDEDSKPNSETTVEQPEAPIKSEKNADEDEVIANVEVMTGGSFIKNVLLVENLAVINFYDNFDTYKAANPDSNVTEEDYKLYFETSDTIDRILVTESVRLLRKTPELSGVKVTLPYEGKVYSIDLNRDSLTEYLGFDVGELAENKDWNEKFMVPYGDDDLNRKKLFNEFGTVN
ncbi:MAG: hypothetical protein ABS935_02915 [Solibacillus sp.]|uniref:hypothetical protein n=1 Tax=Solibacillus sp. TaxID=1909654 RepID=UPI00331619D4